MWGEKKVSYKARLQLQILNAKVCRVCEISEDLSGSVFSLLAHSGNVVAEVGSMMFWNVFSVFSSPTCVVLGLLYVPRQRLI